MGRIGNQIKEISKFTGAFILDASPDFSAKRH
jgi:hypothetical protein